MIHGQITCEVTVSGEPHRVLRNWRASLGQFRPVSASAHVVKRRTSWSDYSPYLGVFSVTAPERMLAEQSLSAASVRLDANEIAGGRHLLDVLWPWLSERSGVPILHQEMQRYRIALDFEGPATDVIQSLKAMHDAHLVNGVQFRLWVLDGRPRTVHVRHPRRVREVDDAGAALTDIEPYRSLLAAGQGDQFAELIKDLVEVFRKRDIKLESMLATAATSKLGLAGGRQWLADVRSSGLWRYGRISQHDLDLLTQLIENSASIEKRNRGNIRAWRP